MTRISGTPVESTAPTPASDNNQPADSSTGGGRVAEYFGTRFFYGPMSGNQRNRGSARARQLATIAAKRAAINRKLAARRRQRRRGTGGAGDGDDEFGDEFGDAMHDEHRRAEAGGEASGDGGGSGGQSHHDEYGDAGSDRSAQKLDVKVLHPSPLREPAPGALEARIAAEGVDVRHEQLAHDWCGVLVLQRSRLAADPTYKSDVDYFHALLDLQRTKQQLGPLQRQGLGVFIEMLKTLSVSQSVETPAVGTTQANPSRGPSSTATRELTPIERENVLLPLKAYLFDAPRVPSRLKQSINTIGTQCNALQARRGKR